MAKPQSRVRVKILEEAGFCRYITTEYQVETVRRPNCGEATSGEFPTDVTNSVQYGSQVKRLAVYLHTEQFILCERERQKKR